MSDADTIRELLSEEGLCVPLNPQGSYMTTHDDNDGDRSQRLCVGVSADGDMWIQTLHATSMLRFRMPMIGGGRFPATYNALKILALAIEMDAKARP